MGSTPPLLRFAEQGPAGRGPTGIQGPALNAKAGAPIELKIWVTDDAVHDKEPIKFGRERPGMNVTWYQIFRPGERDLRAAETGISGVDRTSGDAGDDSPNRAST